MRYQGTLIVTLVALGAEFTKKALGVQSVDSKYDFGTTIFSPKGRIYQVEYASEVQSVLAATRTIGVESTANSPSPNTSTVP